MFDLGDIWMADRWSGSYGMGPVEGAYRLIRTFYDVAAHSVPLFVIPGNHDDHPQCSETTPCHEDHPQCSAHAVHTFPRCTADSVRRVWQRSLTPSPCRTCRTGARGE